MLQIKHNGGGGGGGVGVGVGVHVIVTLLNLYLGSLATS